MDASSLILGPADLDRLLSVLRSRGYTTVGPTVREGAVVLAEIESASELPKGLADVQQGGTYRLEPTGDERHFAFAVGPMSARRFLQPSRLTLWKAKATEDGFTLEKPEKPPTYAFLGLRACDLAAIAVQDKVFLESGFEDGPYKARREDAFFVAVQCSRAGGTCFCVSMGTGPAVDGGADLVLTELDGGRRLLLVAASERGREVAQELAPRPAEAEDLAQADAIVAETAASMGRKLKTEGLVERLKAAAESPHWAEVASRCLGCANCTLVCPTCFCMTIDDVPDLSGRESERVRSWDSCFNLEFSYVHGGSVRQSLEARYRQWMTHKLATWHDQFGTSGCVGCGRCITWCPVGIDITAEAAALEAEEAG